MTQPRIEPWSPGPLVNTLTIMPISGMLYYMLLLLVIIANLHLDLLGKFWHKSCQLYIWGQSI